MKRVTSRDRNLLNRAYSMNRTPRTASLNYEPPDVRTIVLTGDKKQTLDHYGVQFELNAAYAQLTQTLNCYDVHVQNLRELIFEFEEHLKGK